MEMLQEHLDANNRFHFQGYNSDKFFRIQVIFHDLRWVGIGSGFRTVSTSRFPALDIFGPNHEVTFVFPRYILISKPSVWAEELRIQFLEGLKNFLALLNCMQVAFLSC